MSGASPTSAANAPEYAQWHRFDRRARNIILQGLDRTMMHHTLNTTTSHGVWSRLCDLYQVVDAAYKMAATKAFHTLTLKDEENIDKYVSLFRSARARLASCRTLLTETEAAEAFLALLPGSSSAFATSQFGLINQSKAALKLGMGQEITLSDVISNLLAEQVQRDSHKRGSGSSSSAKALFVSKNKTNKPYKQKDGNSFNSSAKRKAKKGPCNWCRIPGHYEKECRKKLAGESRRPAIPETHVTSSKPTVLLARVTRDPKLKDSWYLDSGASDHVTYGRSLFTSYENRTSNATLVVGNDTTCAIVGSGSVQLQSNKGELIILQNVLYVPMMIKNLISLSKLLATDEVEAKFDTTRCKLLKSSNLKVLAEAHVFDNLYRFQLRPVCAVPTVQVTARARTDRVDTTMLWHARLGHVHESKLHTLCTDSSLFRHPLPKLGTLPFCESCAKGKLKQTPYARTSAYRASKLLELVHTDLCGPVSTPSFAGSLYFMPFVDDFSRMTFVYYLKRKNEALETFQRYLTMAERQTDKQFKQLRTDCAGELTSTDFTDFYTTKGILQQVTVPYEWGCRKQASGSTISSENHAASSKSQQAVLGRGC